MLSYLLEYNASQAMFHRNDIVEGERFKHTPCTSGFMPLCVIDDEELSEDEAFLDFRDALREQGVSYAAMFQLVNEWVFRWKRDKGRLAP